MSEPDQEIIIPATATPLLGAMAALGSFTAFGLAALLIGEQRLEPAMRYIAAILGALWGTASLLVALRLFAPRTGLVVDRKGGRLGFCISRRADTWWLPTHRITAISVQAVAIPGAAAIERWLCQARLDNGVFIVIVESMSRDFIETVADGLRTRIGVHAPDESDARPLLEAGDTTFAVRRGGALQPVVVFFGLAMAVTGTLALSQLNREPVVGFILGPLLLMLGLALTITAAVKRFSRERIRFDGLHWHHSFEIGRFTWGSRTIRATSPIWRIHMLGARGAYLELKGDDGTIIIGSSANALSRNGIDDLAKLPDRFTVTDR